VVGEERKVSAKTVTVAYIEGGIAVVEGIEPGTKVVAEGAQNLRPGSTVTTGEGRPGGKGKGKGEGPKGEGAAKGGEKAAT